MLLGGESGVGKSRLPDELRILALVEGAQVVRGQAVSEGKSRCTSWRRSCVCSVSTSIWTTTVLPMLKDLIPDLPVLLQRPVADAPALDLKRRSSGCWRRWQRCCKVRVPVLLLEDLHWAATETITLLQRLQPQLQYNRCLSLPAIAMTNDRSSVQELPAPSSARYAGSAPGRGPWRGSAGTMAKIPSW